MTGTRVDANVVEATMAKPNRQGKWNKQFSGNANHEERGDEHGDNMITSPAIAEPSSLRKHQKRRASTRLPLQGDCEYSQYIP